jgi:hypothetical protein
MVLRYSLFVLCSCQLKVIYNKEQTDAEDRVPRRLIRVYFGTNSGSFKRSVLGLFFLELQVSEKVLGPMIAYSENPFLISLCVLLKRSDDQTPLFLMARC